MTNEERLASLETKFEMFLKRQEKTDEEIKSIRSDMKEMERRYYIKWDAVDRKFDENLKTTRDLFAGSFIVGILAIIISIWLK